MPIMFIFDRARLSLLLGSMWANIFSVRVFFTAGPCFFFMTLRPQKVKKIDTLLPVAAAPLARMNVAMARSRLSLKHIRVLFLPAGAHAAAGLSSACCFLMRTV